MRRPDPTAVALVHAPHGRDALVAGALLKEAGMQADARPHLQSIAEALDENACFLVLTIEAVRRADIAALTRALAAQPPWSDIPIILLTQRGGGLERNPEAARLWDALGNVSFLERPFHPTTFVSLARAALKSRRRQFEARGRIEEIREREASLAAALAAGRLGSWQYGAGSEDLAASASCKALFGRQTSDELGYHDLLAAIHPDDRPETAERITESLRSGDDLTLEVRIESGGETRWAELRARVLAPDGARARLVGVSADITARKLREQTLRDSRDLLEQRVAERTAELKRAHELRLAEVEQRERAEALLHQAQKMEMIGQLTGGVAHDFNNLLMAVLGNLELLRKHAPSDPRTTRLIDGALEGARRGATLTQRLLAFSRRQDLEVKPRHLPDLVRGMADLLERSVGPLAGLEYDLDDGAPHAAVDASQVELALMNLVINARDALPEGGTIRIEVAAVEEANAPDLAAGRYVRLRVIDTGAGMDSQTLAKAAEPFFSTKAVGKGTGLGLSMVHGLAVQLKGTLRLASTVGRGTTADLLLPAALAPAEENAAPPAPPDAVAGARLRILVVDDDPLIAMSTVAMLEDLGHLAVEQTSAAEALAWLDADGMVDLIITDYAMPNMTGLELARRVRERRPGLSVLLATGFADLSGATDGWPPRLTKPYTQAQLGAAIAASMVAAAGAR